jgi:hypothetical protein
MSWIEKLIISIVLKTQGAKMQAIQDFLSGKKTYLVGITAIIGAAVAWSQGQITPMEAIQAIIAAVGAMTLRAGISKSGPQAPVAP